jgi:hypothetical protein
MSAIACNSLMVDFCVSCRLMEDLLLTISKQTLQFLNALLNSNEIKKIGPFSGRSSMHCMNCGIDHETRNFLRAILLKILDFIEISPEYIEFLRDNDILNNSGYEIYNEACKLIPQRQRVSLKKELAVEQEKVLSSVSRIIALGNSGLVATNFLALSSEGQYLVCKINTSLVLKGTKENSLVEFTGRLKIVGSSIMSVDADSMKVVEYDDDLIPKRESILTSHISDINTDGKWYRILAEVVSKELEIIEGEYGKLRIKDATGEIEYTTKLDNIYQKLKVGDKIDLIGHCSLRSDDRIFFHSIRDIHTIHFLDSSR